MNRKWLAIKQLDAQLKEWQTVSHKFTRPQLGWVKTLRMALNMSAVELAKRLGITRGRVMQLEEREMHDAVTLRSLKDAAHAMECEFVYAIVPKNSFSLENIIEARANEVAAERIATVAHSMSLEAQSVDKNYLATQQKALAKKIGEALNKKLWAQLKNEKNEKPD